MLIRTGHEARRIRTKSLWLLDTFGLLKIHLAHLLDQIVLVAALERVDFGDGSSAGQGAEVLVRVVVGRESGGILGMNRRVTWISVGTAGVCCVRDVAVVMRLEGRRPSGQVLSIRHTLADRAVVWLVVRLVVRLLAAIVGLAVRLGAAFGVAVGVSVSAGMVTAIGAAVAIAVAAIVSGAVVLNVSN